MIKAVFLDIDNTLLDFDAYVKQTMTEGFLHYGLKPFEESMFGVFTEINNRLWNEIEQGKLDFKGLEKIRFNMVFRALGIDFDGEEFEAYFREHIWDSAIALDGADEMLRYLAGKYILCIASNGPYEQQLHRLDIGGMKKYFDYYFISEKLGVSKPESAFFQKALEELNRGRAKPILPEECVMLGDSLRSDIAGGKNAGMKTVWFNRSGKSLQKTVIPDFEIHNLKQIKEIL